ncbi:MAG: response regulator [Burkholderiales bacterium]|nr:response regulator [Burkholderiales bacterium]
MPDHALPHVLAVDDDPAIRRLVADYLAENDLRVTVAGSGGEMLAVLAAEAIDMVVMDLRMPSEDGMRLARDLRERSGIPIIILTGKRDVADRVMALELGADDYITKPFNPRELLARIRAVLRRYHAAVADGHAAAARVYRFGGWELKTGTRRVVSSNGEAIELTAGEFNLLLALLAAPQRVLTRDQLLAMSRVHDGEVYDRSVDVQIFRLRRKIEDDPSHPHLIKTERGVGYVFSMPVEVLR